MAGSLVYQPPHPRGRKFVEVLDPTLEPALERMLSDEIAGDPMSDQNGSAAVFGASARLLKKKVIKPVLTLSRACSAKKATRSK
jgi:hypothetical protein